MVFHNRKSDFAEFLSKSLRVVWSSLTVCLRVLPLKKPLYQSPNTDKGELTLIKNLVSETIGLAVLMKALNTSLMFVLVKLKMTIKLSTQTQILLSLILHNNFQNAMTQLRMLVIKSCH